MEDLDQHWKRLGSAINILLGKNHIEAALMLTFSGIDQMAWFSVSGDESTSHDFKNWAEKYIKPAQTLGCSVEDLWAARCALLHTATSESRDTLKGKAKKIYYTTGAVECTKNESSDVVIINAHTLIQSFIESWFPYRLDIESDAGLLQQAIEKAGRTLSFRDSV